MNTDLTKAINDALVARNFTGISASEIAAIPAIADLERELSAIRSELAAAKEDTAKMKAALRTLYTSHAICPFMSGVPHTLEACHSLIAEALSGRSTEGHAP